MMKGKPGALIALLGTKKDDEGDEAEGDGDASGVFGEYAGDAYDAIKAGDKKAFADALKSAVKACYDEEE